MAAGVERTRGGSSAGRASKVADFGTELAVQIVDLVAPHSHIDKPAGMAGE